MHHSARTDHARHDLTLIAGHAAGDLTNRDSAAAAALLADCAACAEIHRDLVAISSATRGLPRTAPAPRDFRITADQAQRLRNGSWLRTLLRPFASPRSATRPLATAFTSVGVAGLLVAVLLPAVFGGLGGAASSPSARQDGAGAPAATSAPAMAPGTAESDCQGGACPGAAAGPTDDTNYLNAQATQPVILANGGDATGGDDPGDGDLEGTRTADVGADLMAATTSNPVIAGSLGLLGVGLALFGLRLAARRLR